MTDYFPNSVLSLFIPYMSNEYSIQDIINYNFIWTDTGKPCNNGCLSKIQECQKILTVSSILVLQLSLWKVENRVSTKHTDFIIKNNISETIMINDISYRVVSIIFHHGISLHSGHYTNILQNNGSWYQVDDKNVQLITTIPTLNNLEKIQPEVLLNNTPHCNNKRKHNEMHETIINSDDCLIIEPKKMKYTTKNITNSSIADKVLKKSIEQNDIIIQDLQNQKFQKHIIVEDINTRSNEIHDIIGLPNNDGVSCYANAALQSILHSTVVRDTFLNNPEKNVFNDILHTYFMKKRVDIIQLRAFVHSQYIPTKQHDAAEFIMHLCNKSSNLNSLIQHQLIFISKCLSCGDTNITDPIQNHVLTLSIPSSARECSIQEIINFNLNHWSNTNCHCKISGCLGNTQDKLQILYGEPVLILQLSLWDVKDRIVFKRDNFTLTNSMNDIISINDLSFKIVSIVFHHGSNIESGHYTNILKNSNGYWYQIDDQNVQPLKTLDTLKYANLIFLEKTKPNMEKIHETVTKYENNDTCLNFEKKRYYFRENK